MSFKKLLELIKEINKVAGYNINTQKSIALLYTNDLPKKDIKKITPLTIALKIVFVLRPQNIAERN